MGRMRKWGICCIVIVIVTLFFLITIQTIRKDNAAVLLKKLESPESIYNGSYDTSLSGVDRINGICDTEIHISFYDENIGYDEKNISLLNRENHAIRGFNSYYIKFPNQKAGSGENDEAKTVWLLCRYDIKIKA